LVLEHPVGNQPDNPEIEEDSGNIGDAGEGVLEEQTCNSVSICGLAA